MVAATGAAETRDMKRAPKKCEFSLAELRRDSLHVKIPAVGTMPAENVADGNRPAIEAALAVGASPGAQSGDADDEIRDSAAA
jgi:hypothetical protein